MTDPHPAELVTAASQIAEEASSLPMRYFRRGVDIDLKADDSPVTIADRETETLIRARIEARFPGHGIFGEEHGRVGMDRRFVWIIDPIDGTKSFISGVPLFGMLMGVLDDGKPTAGVIRMPALDETYSGGLNTPALRNNQKIQVDRVERLDRATVFINEASRVLRDHPEVIDSLQRRSRLTRFANDCYTFALLASGQIHALIDTDLQPYDYLPALPVVEAAGGIMTDWNGLPLTLSSNGSVAAASTPELHRELLDLPSVRNG